ncbi:MAG: DUF2520 domain-containing protein [Dehalococcoidales bacterium]|nr:DUF2520 domain-containing protein [Dehalococcoidales bacterium]
MIKSGFIGAGTVATALAVALSHKGYPVVAVSSRSQQSTDKLAHLIDDCYPCDSNQEVADKAELVFITTPDDVIASVVTEIKWRPGQSVVHCSGADSADILAPAREAGASVGAFHPLQTFAGLRQENLPGITYALEAEEPLLTTLKEMASALGGRWIVLKAEDKILYHTAAVFACNYLITLVKIATDMWQHFGIPPQQATQALLPLLRGTINNIDATGIPRCLTGPIARGDSGTIKKHMDVLQKAAPELIATYRELGLKTIPIALSKVKINDKQADELEAILCQPAERKAK